MDNRQLVKLTIHFSHYLIGDVLAWCPEIVEKGRMNSFQQFRGAQSDSHQTQKRRTIGRAHIQVVLSL